MRFCVLGPVELAVEDRRVPLASDRRRTILAILLVHAGEAVSSDRLIDLVWQGAPPPTAPGSLRSHVSRLRSQLADADPAAGDALVHTRAGYRLDLQDHELDAELFAALVTEATRVRGTDLAAGLERLDAALHLWDGPAYGDLAGHDGIRAEARRLTALRTRALGDRIDLLLDLGHHVEVIAELEARVDADPLHERAARQLMLALYRSGRQASALAVHQRLRKQLRDELGVDPTPEVQHLHAQMLRHDDELEAPTPATVAPSAQAAAVRSGRAPPDRGDALLGRDEDVAAIARLVTERSLVTVTGPGGVGKTRVAQAVAEAVTEAFPDGVLTCALAAVHDAERVSTAVVTSLGVPDTGGEPADEVLVAALADRRLLLLDNCEHLVPGVTALIARIRAHCPGVTVLVTSRARLRLPGERVWNLDPLALPPSDASAVQVLDSPAGALFRARAEAAAADFVVTDATAPAIADVCRRLDGLPLAIELAAARTRALPPGEIAARLHHRFELLTAGPTDQAAGRHETLRAVVDWSHDLLDPGQARLFARLSVFAGAFDLAAAERVCADGRLPAAEVAGGLADLVDHSMVTVVPGADIGRFRLLETLRDYGSRRLADDGDEDAIRRAHARQMVETVEARSPVLRGPHDVAARRETSRSMDDLRLAQGWLQASQDTDLLLRMAAGLHDVVVHRLQAELVGWAQEALASAPASHPQLASVLATVAWGAASRRDLGTAERVASDALNAPGHDPLGSLRARHVLTDVALLDGRPHEAVRRAERWLAAAERAGDGYHRAYATATCALGHLYAGDRATAARAAAAAEQAAETCGSATMRAWSRFAHGEVVADTDPDRARALLDDAVDTARRADSRLVEGVAQVSRAALLARHGVPEEAVSAFRDALAHWRRLGNPLSQVTALRNLVGLLVRTGAYEQAAVLHGAVTTDALPSRSFGVEGQRLAAAWARLEDELGGPAARAAAERGRQVPLPQLVTQVLDQLAVDRSAS